MKRKNDTIDIIIGIFAGVIVLTICLSATLQIEKLCSKPIETTYEIAEL
jgi:hypothetical protein